MSRIELDRAALIDELRVLIVDELNLRRVKAEEIDPSAPLFGPGGLGLDSLDALQIASALEQKYSVRFPGEQAADEGKAILASVNSIADFVSDTSTSSTD